MTNKENIINNYLEQLEIKKEINTIEDINKLIKKHLNAFYFSSIPVLLEKHVSLDLEDIYKKIVEDKKGAYCFEQNKLFYEVLKHNGFEVKHYLARVVMNSDNISPQTHRFTLLEHNKERYLVDVGFGFLCPSKAIKFGEEDTYSHLKHTFRIKEYEDKTYALQLVQEDGFFTLYKFDLNKCYEVDFDLGNFYSHKHPNAAFVNNMVLSRISENYIYSLRNNIYQKTSINKQEHIEINTKDEFKKILKEDFDYPIKEEQLDFLYKNYVNR